MSESTATITSKAAVPPGEKNNGGHLVAWAGFVFGSLISVAANVLAARIPPAGTGPAWQPQLDAQIGAAVWPVALLLSVEALARVRWPTGWGWRIARYGGVGAVALFSAVISYGHIHDVLTAWGYSEIGAHVGPLVVDGLMTVAGFALLADHHQHAGDSPVKHPVSSDDAELKARARWLFASDPDIGRYKLRDALNVGRSGEQRVSENQARKILDDLKKETGAHPQAVTNGS
jgi:hypothetical protein